MSIMTTVFPAKVKFSGKKIDMHAGEDISPVLNQTGYYEIRVKERFSTKKHTDILNIPAGFDIETTGTKNAAYMYKWQMVFGEYLISGRTWDEWMSLMEAIQRAYNFRVETVGKGRKKHTFVHTFILWIANQGYEYQFLCRKTWNGSNIIGDDRDGNSDVFADGMRRPLKTMLTFKGDSVGVITVYDALKFSRSLNQLAKDYGITKKKKTTLADGTEVSDLDYKIPRNTLTPLTAEEEEYCDADVEILYEWAHYYLDAYLRQNGIAPMTSTGIIRYAVVESYDTYVTDHSVAMFLHPQFNEYIRAITHLYRGGFTYANRWKAGKEIKNVVGADYTSSYPACMMQELFPCTPFAYKSSVSRETDLDALDGKAWYADFEFEDIVITKGIAVESLFKIHEWTGTPSTTRDKTHCVIDNGKISYAKKMTVTLCEHDWETYKKFYKWNNVKISKCMVAEKDYLPDWFRNVIKHYYKLKANLKATGKAGTTEYALAKAVVNGLYGLTVQKVHFDKVTFENGEWKTTRLNYKNPDHLQEMADMYETTLGRKDPRKTGGAPKIVLSPYYGIWCTAIARKRILDTIYKIGDDFVYCDTDSVYYENEEIHKDVFDEWNDSIHKWNDDNLIEPEFHTLGDFDPVELEEGTGIYKYNFMTLGAKRYIKYTDTQLHATIAGLPRGAFQRRAKKEVGDDPATQVKWMVQHFQNGLKIAAEEAFKNAHKYVDEPTYEAITDINGNTEIMHEDSSIVIYPIEFTLKLDPTYEKVIGMPVEEYILTQCYLKIAEENERF